MCGATSDVGYGPIADMEFALNLTRTHLARPAVRDCHATVTRQIAHFSWHCSIQLVWTQDAPALRSSGDEDC
jgi:hypothetical protein